MLGQLSNSEMQNSRAHRSLPCTKRDKSLLARHLQTVSLVFLHNSTCDFYSKCSGKEEKKNKKESAVMAGSECVEYIKLLRHVKVSMLHLSGNNAIFRYTFAW